MGLEAISRPRLHCRLAFSDSASQSEGANLFAVFVNPMGQVQTLGADAANSCVHAEHACKGPSALRPSPFKILEQSAGFLPVFYLPEHD